MKKIRIIITVRIISDDFTIAEFRCFNFLKKMFTKKYPAEMGYEIYTV
jgi:hypothetical protein